MSLLDGSCRDRNIKWKPVSLSLNAYYVYNGIEIKYLAIRRWVKTMNKHIAINLN